MGDDILNGGDASSNRLKGLAGSDLLNGVGDRLAGRDAFNPADSGGAQKDVLIGGKGSDWFALADAAGSFYAQSLNLDRAIIRDFERKDHLILHGESDLYSLVLKGSSTAELSYNGDLVAKIKGTGVADLSLTNTDQVLFL